MDFVVASETVPGRGDDVGRCLLDFTTRVRYRYAT
jgi:hypothetical protein